MKCAAVIVAVGACAGVLLALRQQRLNIAGELARTQLRISEQDERLWMLRAKIADQTSPRNVQQMAAAIGPLTPIVEYPKATQRLRQVLPAVRVARHEQR